MVYRNCTEMIPRSIGRPQLQEVADGLRIVIPAKWSWYTFVVEPVLGGLILTAAWARQVLDSKVTAAIISILILVTVVRRWVWNVGGKEIVSLSETELTIRHEVFGIG